MVTLTIKICNVHPSQCCEIHKQGKKKNKLLHINKSLKNTKSQMRTKI